MSVKLSRYIFRKIGGRIIPIREGIKQASKQINRVANEAIRTPVSLKTGEPAKKLLVGRGIDFNVFGKKSSIVLKIPRNKSGTFSKVFAKHYPETKDKVAISKAVSDNLPNYGIPTIKQEVIRFKGKIKAIVQPKVKTSITPMDRQKALRNYRYYMDEAKTFKKKYGLNIDAHSGNFDMKGNLIDTGVNLKTSSYKQVKYNDTAKEILGLDNPWGTSLKDAGKTNVLTDIALQEGVSKKALRRINDLIKKGYKYKKSGPNEYKLVFHKLRNKK